MNSIQLKVAKLGSLLRSERMPSTLHIALFVAILALGILARTWGFRSLPPGLNPDEASSAVDAYSLLHYGVDRNGVSFPVFFISWGGGQNALYAYLLMPFIAIGGMTAFVVRLPMLLTGILTLPIVYLIGRRITNEAFGLIAMFLLAISPWHIFLSRWALESNILPFTFSLGFLLVLEALRNSKWFAPAMLFFGLSLYAYGTAYAAVPIFLVCAFPLLIWLKKFNWKGFAFGLAVFAVIAAPIALFVLVNSLHFETIHLGPISIPRLPSRPRYEIVAAPFSIDFFASVRVHLRDLGWLLWSQLDGLIANDIRPYGYFYAYTLPVAALGALLLIPHRPRAEHGAERLLLLAWLLAGVSLGALQQPDINRVNLIFIPLILCVAAVLAWIHQRSWVAASLVCVCFLIAFAFFTRDYHGPQYRAEADKVFYPGLTQAIGFAAQQGNNPICVTSAINMPYIYVMFSRPTNPWEFLQTVRYDRPHGALREVLRFGRYRFGMDQCRKEGNPIYILSGEAPPLTGATYSRTDFEAFSVYTPAVTAP